MDTHSAPHTAPGWGYAGDPEVLELLAMPVTQGGRGRAHVIGILPRPSCARWPLYTGEVRGPRPGKAAVPAASSTQMPVTLTQGELVWGSMVTRAPGGPGLEVWWEGLGAQTTQAQSRVYLFSTQLARSSAVPPVSTRVPAGPFSYWLPTTHTRCPHLARSRLRQGTRLQLQDRDSRWGRQASLQLGRPQDVQFPLPTSLPGSRSRGCFRDKGGNPRGREDSGRGHRRARMSWPTSDQG